MSWRKRYLRHIRLVARAKMDLLPQRIVAYDTLDVPVIDGVATLPDGRVFSGVTAAVVRVPIPVYG